MVRTAAATFRASGGKSAKAGRSANTGGGGNPHSSSHSHEKGSSGGNSVCHRDTPTWQKPITNFFIKNPPNKTNDNCESSSKTSTTKDVNLISERSNKSNKTNGETQPGNDKENLPEPEDGAENEGSSGSGLTKMDASKESVLQESKGVELEKNKNVNTQSDDDCEDTATVTSASLKKPKLDFYKHLEEIENMSP